MTVGEYKAWVDGFLDGLSKTPTKGDLKKILAKLESVSDSGCSCCGHWHWNAIYSPFYSGNTTDTITTGNDCTGTASTSTVIYGGNGDATTSKLLTGNPDDL